MAGKRKSPDRVKSRRHPLLQARPRGVWYPDLVGLVSHYPKTQEAFDKRAAQCREQVIRLNAEGKTGRRGVPDGWAGKKKEVAEIRAQAAVDAERIYRIMVERDMFDEAAELVTSDEDRSELAMKCLISTFIDKTQMTKDRIAASRAVLEFCKTKPIQKSAMVLHSADSFLDLIAETPNKALEDDSDAEGDEA